MIDAEENEEVNERSAHLASGSEEEEWVGWEWEKGSVSVEGK